MANKSSVIRLCEVVDVKDDEGGLRIKVRLPEDGDKKTIDDLPYCFPLLPKHLHVNPKINECVIVFVFNGANAQRWFIGPLISQAYHLFDSSYNTTARTLIPGEVPYFKPLPANEMYGGDNKGTLPKREDIAIQGRGNADMVLMDDELRLRCGHKKLIGSHSKSLEFNRKDLAYIQFKFKPRVDKTQHSTYNSSITMVADRINLLSHLSNDRFKLNDEEKLISDEEMENILQHAHKLIYGDKLVDFLKKLIVVFMNHEHPGAQCSPAFNSDEVEFLRTDLGQMLSASVRIN